MRLDQLINLGPKSTLNRFNKIQIKWLLENLGSSIRDMISVGNHTFIVKQDGTVWATGQYGQLGLGDTTNRNTFTQISSSFNNPKQISCGRYHTFIVKQDGAIWATGSNYYGQLGLGDNSNKYTFTQVNI
jgi:alpha-tubulin suppressor-like RCC1 family protein